MVLRMWQGAPGTYDDVGTPLPSIIRCWRLSPVPNTKERRALTSSELDFLTFHLFCKEKSAVSYSYVFTTLSIRKNLTTN
jgi:hypothetical protein